MTTYDFAPLIKNDIEYGKMVETVTRCYKKDWDDKIHDSYLRYVKQVQENFRKIHSIRCKAETLEKEAYDLKTKELQTIAEHLCTEADSI